MILGITGGIGCGKSTAARLIEGRGFRRVDSDALVRDQVLTLPEVREKLKARLGDGILTADGAVDRPRLAQRVFGDEAALQWLEDLTHPLVFELWRQAFATEPRGRWVVEVPLLFEKKLENWFDFTVCVACAPAQQLARLEQRGLPHALAEQRISTSRSTTIRICHRISINPRRQARNRRRWAVASTCCYCSAKIARQRPIA